MFMSGVQNYKIQKYKLQKCEIQKYKMQRCKKNIKDKKMNENIQIINLRV